MFVPSSGIEGLPISILKIFTLENSTPKKLCSVWGYPFSTLEEAVIILDSSLPINLLNEVSDNDFLSLEQSRAKKQQFSPEQSYNSCHLSDTGVEQEQSITVTLWLGKLLLPGTELLHSGEAEQSCIISPE